ncbi:MAG: 16S rRNA (guanine(527)-N(7))-methyltransferase RsmG [Clostridia bacterium]|nr:16S rRNA (guanine(527)-N(7))-methyltransferase RsmG [Clostridia bacterium]
MFKQIVKECLVGFDNMPIDEIQLERIERFADILLEKNKVMNLTAVREKNEVARRHMADSLFLLKCADLKGRKILDIGTGPGFPGMPLKLYDPELDITMLDSTSKRIAFINEAAGQLGVEVKTMAARAEEVAPQMKGKFDIVTSRAVAALDVLTELSMAFVKVGGYFMPMKSCNEASQEELEKAMHAIEFMGGKLVGTKEYSVEEGVMRQVLIIEKVKHSPKGYPRKYAAISKKPL